MASKWTDERVAKLKELWAQGHSGAVIAVELGLPSRSAAIGKAYRLGLPTRLTTTRSKSEYKRTRKAVASKFNPPASPKREVKTMHVIDMDTWTPRYVEQIPENERVAFSALEDRHCRYPFGEGKDITFCGRDRVRGLSYCASHSRSCYTVTPVKLPDAPEPTPSLDRVSNEQLAAVEEFVA